MVADGGKQTEEHGAKSGGDAPDIVTKSGARGPEKGGKQRRQVHRKQGESSLAEAYEGKPAQEGVVVARQAVSTEHRKEIGEEHRSNGQTIADEPREPAREKIAENRTANHQEHGRIG